MRYICSMVPTGDKHRGMEAFRKAKASALHKLLTVAKCHRTVVFCGDEEHASELAQRLTQAGVHATLQDEAAGDMRPWHAACMRFHSGTCTKCCLPAVQGFSRSQMERRRSKIRSHL